jgi:hypothetical protein
MTMKRSFIAVFAILACLMFAWATGAGRPYPATAGGVIDPTCTSSLPCIEYDNNGTGPGIRGISVSGNGLAGATKNHSTSASNGRAGLIGNDTGTGSFNSGVHGLSVGGTGVFGQSTSGAGVEGVSSTSEAVLGVVGAGVASGFHDGVGGLDNSVSGNTNTGVFGNTTRGEGVLGRSLGSGIGVRGSSVAGVGVSADGGFSDIHTGDQLPALSIVGDGTDLIDACPPSTVNPCDSFHSNFEVQTSGVVIAKGDIATLADIDSSSNFNLFGTGGYLKNSTCVAGCTVATATSVGRAVVTYAPMVSQPTIEDFGEAQLVNGQIYVRLSADFANTIDHRASYLVVVTPEGPSRGLYVTQKTPAGFAVMENPGGHSTLAFSYRIVAKPFGSREARLPMVELPKLRSTSPKQHAWHPGGVVPVH